MEHEHVQIDHYNRLPYRRAFLYELWSAMERDGATRHFFYAQDCEHEQKRGDLLAFVQYCTTPGRDLLVVTTQTRTIGLVWLDMLPARPGMRLINFWYARKTTRLARQATALVMKYVFTRLNCDLLAGFTPYRTAAQHVLSLGWSLQATLPQMAMFGGVPMDLRFYSIDKSTWAARQTEGAPHAATL